MPELSKDAIALFVFILPGFLAAWVMYGLTSHTKPSQFERVVQALIYTFIIQCLMPIMEWGLCHLGSVVIIRPWDHISQELTRLLLSLLLGVVLAYYTNNDKIHKWLREKEFTTRASYPSEWFGVLSTKVTYVVLHLNDERRLYGWPKEWPTESEKGHFYIMQPTWLVQDEEPVELTGVLDGVLISAKDVKWVEFIERNEEKEIEK